MHGERGAIIITKCTFALYICGTIYWNCSGLRLEGPKLRYLGYILPAGRGYPGYHNPSLPKLGANRTAYTALVRRSFFRQNIYMNA